MYCCKLNTAKTLSDFFYYYLFFSSEMFGREDAQRLWPLTHCSSGTFLNSLAQRKSTENLTRLLLFFIQSVFPAWFVFISCLSLWFLYYACHETLILDYAFCFLLCTGFRSNCHLDEDVWQPKQIIPAYHHWEKGIFTFIASAALSAFFFLIS